MTDYRKRAGKRKPSVTRLQLDRETVQELTEGEASGVEGGRGKSRYVPGGCVTGRCRPSAKCPTLQYDCKLA
jgi:hypothetical protein